MLTEPQKSKFSNDLRSLPPITQRYLLVIGIKCYRDEKGSRYLDQLWYKDLLQHLEYLKNLTLACPCQYAEPPKNAISLDGDPSFSQVQFIDLPAPNSFAQAIKLLPTTVLKLWKAVGQADIVHADVAGWPISLGWIVTPIVRLRQKLYVTIVESATWRLQPGIPATIQSRIRAYISERLNRWCVNNTDLAIFTQEEYKQSLLTKRPNRGHIIHASWIDEENIISEADAREIWHKKLSSSTKELKVLFAGRLVCSKGVLVLLEAMKVLDKENIPVKLDILGEGDLLRECEKASQSLQNSTNIRMLGTLPYSCELFELLRDYHAVVIPSISDEQPRIVYDAYSQGVPLLASDTNGIRDCIKNGETGRLTKSNDPVALANLLKWSWQNLEQLEPMGMASLKVAESLLHRTIHEKRWLLLLEMLDESASQ